MNQDNLIVFFVSPKKVINGGILSIFSQCKESRRFYKIHSSESVISTYPGSDTYGRNDLFENSEKVYSFDQIIKKWKTPKKIILNIPETAVALVTNTLKKQYQAYLDNIPNIQINVMTQNIGLAPSPLEFAELFSLTPSVTQTTAHVRYTSQELSDKYQTPVHLLSVFNDKSQYQTVPYEQKENLILYSTDEHPVRDKVLEILSSLKGYELKEIKGIPYEEYKKLAARAKFSISFREGFNGYFVDSFFSDSIGLAVYNDEFFPDKSYLDLPSVFKDYDALLSNLSEVIKALDNKRSYESCVKLGRPKIEKIYDYKDYLNNIEAFYKGKYDYVPNSGSSAEFINKIVKKKNQELEKLSNQSFMLEKKLKEKDSQIIQLKDTIGNLLNSNSWKLTKPLRKLNRRGRSK